MRTALLVPYRPDGAQRDANWAWIRTRFEYFHPDIEIVTDPGLEEGPFARGIALNRAAMKTNAEILIITDGDAFVRRDALLGAIQEAQLSSGQVIAYDRRVQMARRSTYLTMISSPVHEEPPIESQNGTEVFSISSMVVCDRETFEVSGGFDSRIRGWGGEDWQWQAACWAFYGQPRRIRGTLWHLWHPEAVESPGAGARGDREAVARRKANYALTDRYGDVKNDRGAMRKLIMERQGLEGEYYPVVKCEV